MPLHIILRGIERVFDTIDKQANRKRSVKSLFYCKEEIEAQYAEWSESQVGASSVESGEWRVESEKPETNEMFSDEAIKAHLEKVSAELQTANAKTSGDLRETLERVLNRLAGISESYETAEKLEESLEKLDALVDETLLKYAVTENLQKETENQLASYQNKMDSEVFSRTVELMVLKKFREKSKIPRLSLFYL